MERACSHAGASSSCLLRTWPSAPSAWAPLRCTVLWGQRLVGTRAAHDAAGASSRDAWGSSGTPSRLKTASPELSTSEDGGSPVPAGPHLTGTPVLGLDEAGKDVQGTKGPSASPLLASASAVGVLALMAGGMLMKDQIRGFLEFFIAAVDNWGLWGYVAYAVVYAALEVLAVPAIPLTMTAGAIFGTVEGTLLVSLSGTVAAAIAFLIARYAARDKVREFAYKHPKFAAMDRAIGRNGLKFVTLLRLSPLLPLAASNYLYGLTSVDLGSYVLGSWIGMLPGTWAYVHTGAVGRSVLLEGEGSLTIDTWQVGLGLGATLLALGFVGRLAKNALDEAEQEQLSADTVAGSEVPGAGQSSAPTSTPSLGTPEQQ